MKAKPSWYTKPDDVEDIDDALKNVTVHFPGDWSAPENELVADCFAVSTADDGIIAYFYSEDDAFAFRYMIIARWLNG